MIDVLAHHVADVQCAGGTGRDVHWTKPLIRRGQKITPRRRVPGTECRPTRVEHLALHEVLRRLADERAAATDADAARAGVGAGMLLVDQARDVGGRRGVGTERVDRRGGGHDVLDSVGKRDVRVPPQDGRREDDVHERVAVAGDEAMAQRVKTLAKLPGTGERLVHKRLRVEAPILPLGVHGGALGVQRTGDAGVGEAARDIDPAVRPQHRGGHAELLTAAPGAKAGQDNLPHVGPPVAGRVLQEPDVWRAGDKHPAIPQQDAVGKREAIGKGRAPVEPSVPVGVLEQRHRAEFARTLALLRIAARLDDVHPARSVEAQRHRIPHQRLGGGQFHPNPRFHLERLQRLCRRKRPSQQRDRQ